jgi:mono/diheme cytochrome c family protein
MQFLRAVTVRCSLLLLMYSWSISAAVAADTGSALYRAKCATCHGKNGEGKAGAKAPSLKSAKVKSMSDDELKAIISQRVNGEMEKKSRHTMLKKRLTGEQIGGVIGYIREMQSR